MITIKKLDNGISPDIRVSDGVNSFVIARNNLPDPCWYPEINDSINNEDITFIIKEEDGIIHALFNKLYQDIIDGNIFLLTKEDFKEKSPKEIKKLKGEQKKEKIRYKKHAQMSGLINNGVINWHSEDYDAYDCASVLTIKRVEKQIEITFSKNKENPNEGFMRTIPTYNVRITESGSRYWPFHVIFVNFRRQLQLLELEEPVLTNDQPQEVSFSKKKKFATQHQRSHQEI